MALVLGVQCSDSGLLAYHWHELYIGKEYYAQLRIQGCQARLARYRLSAHLGASSAFIAVWRNPFFWC